MTDRLYCRAVRCDEKSRGAYPPESLTGPSTTQMAALRSNPWAATVLLHPSLLSVMWNSTIREIVELDWRIESLAGLRGALRVPTGLVEAARDGNGAEIESLLVRIA